jgi:adenosylmethionine-8-amino-7-oxononanoate aminotransferase
MPDTVQALDHSHLWHPFTQQQGWSEEEPLVIERAEGTDLIGADGRRYIDGVSSLWCNVHGHRHAETSATGSHTRRCSASPTGRRPTWLRGWSGSRPRA